MAYRKRKEEGSSLFERVTQKLVAELGRGHIPWSRPWRSDHTGLPRNYVSNRPYSGVNVLLTWLSALEHGFSDTRWLTANQIMALGGSFRGERATRVVFAREIARAAGTVDEETYFVLKGYNVFNAEQVQGVLLEPESAPEPLAERLGHAESFIAAQGVAISHGGDRAYYAPARDAVQLPFPGTFSTREAYYAVALHELAHATAHPTRLDRPGGPRGSREYAFEELVAELAAAFMCAELGVGPVPHHAGYLQFYAQLLEDDPKAIFRAAREAGRAADFMRLRASGPPLQAA